MKETYNEFAGHSVEPLAGLSDGLFRLATRMLLLDCYFPAIVGAIGVPHSGQMALTLPVRL